MMQANLYRHVSRGIASLLIARHGFQSGWRAVRLIWLSGHLDGREVPMWTLNHGIIRLDDLRRIEGPMIDPATREARG
jgi:hypothetical protein